MMRVFKVLFVKELSLIFIILCMCDYRVKYDNLFLCIVYYGGGI